MKSMTEEQVRAITEELINTLLKKNEDYGGASFDLGLNGNMVHLWDKISRYRSLIEKFIAGKGSPNFESIEDTLQDIMGYAVIGLIILEDQKYNKDGKTKKDFS
ncbi:MAG TPA: nucleotide modification associated domain-containing protein [Mucilaginibacter sp.]|nr:nucleotide modification associated domain-containing protein [Mucilaginibacter sp.]